MTGPDPGKEAKETLARFAKAGHPVPRRIDAASPIDTIDRMKQVTDYERLAIAMGAMVRMHDDGRAEIPVSAQGDQGGFVIWAKLDGTIVVQARQDNLIITQRGEPDE